MPVFTSDGNQYENEFHQEAETIPTEIPRITVTPKPPEEQSGERGAWNALTGADGKERYQLWPEKAVRTMLDAFSLPGDVLQGKEDPLSQKATGRAFELAGALVFGPAPLANKIVDGTLGVIGGINARGAPQASKDAAEMLLAKGEHPDIIYATTGWFKGLEGKWRFEIPDQQVKFKEDFIPLAVQMVEQNRGLLKVKLGEVIEHPELFKNYPDLKNVEFHIDNNIKSLAHYIEMGGTKPDIIALNLNSHLNSPNAGHPLESVLHEIQHAVQARENFNRGASASVARKKMTDFLESRAFSAKDTSEMARLFNLASRIAKDPITQFGEPLSKVLYRRTPGEIEAQAVQLKTKSHMKEETIPNIIKYELPPPLATPKELGLSSY